MDPKLETAAERAYKAFCEAPRVYIPFVVIVPWEKLPDVLKNAWRKAAAAAREN